MNRPARAYEDPVIPQPESDAGATPFKVYGLQRTGTNLMQALMARNFHVRYLTEQATGWKHGPLSEAAMANDGVPTRFIFCVKNPYAWLVSCYRYFRGGYQLDQTLPASFYADPSMSFEEFLHRPMYEFPTPLHRWNFMNRCWLMSLPEKRTVVARQEDHLQDELQHRLLAEIECKFSLRRRSEHLEVTDRQVDVNTTVKGPVDRDRYLLREYMAEYSPSLLALVNQSLDHALVSRLGYVPEHWALGERRIGDVRLLVRQCTSDGQDAWAVLDGDPYQFKTIRAEDPNVSGIVDIGSHVGATVLHAKQLWPDAQVIAFEPWLENYRMLRINTRSLDGIQCVPAVVSDGIAQQAWFDPACDPAQEDCPTSVGQVSADGRIQVPAVGLRSVLEKLGRVALLKIGCGSAVVAILGPAVASGLVSSIGWVCGRLDGSEAENSAVLDALRATHTVSVTKTSHGHFFLAELTASSS